MARDLRRLRRSAYTLLEVLLSLAIGLLLMAALYVALDIHMQYAETGRQVVQQATLARSLLTRIGNDITGSLAPPDLGRLLGSSSGNAGAQGGAATTPAAGTTGQTGTGQAATSGTQTAAPATGGTATGLNIAAPAFNLTVQGDATHLSLFVARVP